MSLYSDYIKEITNDGIIEIEEGFATYRYINTQTVYIIDIFVLPEHRKKRIAFKLVDMIVQKAKERGCTELLGTVSPTSPVGTISMKGHLAYGMTLHSVANNAIILKKDI